MTLRQDTRGDLAEGVLQPQSWQPDPRGAQYGKKLLSDGPAIPCTYVDVGATEAFGMGIEKHKRAVKMFVDAIVEGSEKSSPVTETQSVVLEGRTYNVVHPKVVYSEDSVILFCESA